MVHPVYSSYRYVGCYTQVFYDSYFISSYMEPKLCFSLCQTPIIYIQHRICRCSGSGLMDYNRQRDKFCNIQCPKPGNRQDKTTNTCGGIKTYSVYVEEQFYTRHAYLLNYQIQFASCELWNSSNYYNTFQVQIDGSSVRSSLNKLERCAAACLDQNATTKSIGRRNILSVNNYDIKPNFGNVRFPKTFNDDINQCSCIMPNNLNVNSNGALNLIILSNNNCDRYCNNIVGDSKVEHKFKCGSSSDRRIWAVYSLNDACPIDSIYIKELKRCISIDRQFIDSCSPPSMHYVFDGNITWNVFLKIINKLNLTKSIVSIAFNNDVTIDPSWTCSKTTTNIDTINSNLSNASYSTRNFNTNYVLDNGCLRIVSFLSYLYRSSYRLCIENPINRNLLSYTTRFYPIYTSDIDYFMITSCPMNWFDLNKHCYRISDEVKTIQDARNSCINISKVDEIKKDKEIIFSDEDNDDNKNEMRNNIKNYINDLYTGEIAQYTSQWQAHLGFYLLDTNLSNTETILQQLNPFTTDVSSAISNGNINRSSINEFQMINLMETNKTIVIDDSCIVVTRSPIDGNKSPMLKNIHISNCSKPRHVLCKTKSIFFQSEQRCLSKPLTFGLPAIISNQLTHELCLSMCKTLQTTLAILYINKCYCLNSDLSWMLFTKPHYENYQKKDCGNPCPGNQHEHCGNENTIVVIENPSYIFSSKDEDIDKITTFTSDFAYDTCIHLNSVNQSTTYEFNLTDENDIHPRHCLELCTNYKQKYALLNSNKCLCTNILTKKKQDDPFSSSNFNCTQECSANYFYTCGNPTNSSIYSVYVMKIKCPLGFQISKDERRCVRADVSTKKSSFSTAQSYCKSVDG
ncbi:unnamed protein product, partial [Rotaria sp. Silwood1]